VKRLLPHAGEIGRLTERMSWSRRQQGPAWAGSGAACICSAATGGRV